MAKRKSKLSIIFAVMLIVALSLFTLTACNGDNDGSKPGNGDTTIEGGGSNPGGNDEGGSTPTTPTKKYDVKFMVRANGMTGDYAQLAVVKTNDDGSVTVPTIPTYANCEFVAWYTNEECTSAVFDTTAVTADSTVYAKYTDRKYNVNVIDELGSKAEKGEKTVAEIRTIAEQEKATAKGKDLEFDGWYENESCTTVFDPANSEAEEIFGRYMARVTYNNGYEDLQTELVKPNSKVVAPTAEKITEGRNYMSQNNIYYVDNEDNSKDFDFDAGISKSVTVRVLWETPYLTYNYEVAGNGPLACYGNDYTHAEELKSFPVISIPSRRAEGTIVAAQVGFMYTFDGMKEVIFNEGIKYISGFNGHTSGTQLVEKVTLPSTLVVLENSFNELPKLQSIELNDGLEAIFDCFWKEYGVTPDRTAENKYAFNIKVPSTVETMVNVPLNLDLTGTKYAIENNRVVKNVSETEKVLVSEFASNVVDKTLSIPVGITAIQVGALGNIQYDYLNIPSTFNKVSYNVAKESYADFCISTRFTDPAIISGGADAVEVKPKGNVNSYAIVNNLSDHKYINFDSVAYPADMNKYAFSDSGEKFEALENNNVVFIGEQQEGGEVTVFVNFTNQRTDTKTSDQLVKIYGATLTIEDLTNLCSLDAEVEQVKLVSEFGEVFDFNTVIKRNHYIDVLIISRQFGITFEDVGESYIVTGLDLTDEDNNGILDNVQNIGDDVDVRYKVNVPATYKGKPVSGIKANAFNSLDSTKDAKAIEQINNIAEMHITADIISIGEYAFKGATKLAVVEIQSTKLETVGEGAFEFAGAKLNLEKEEALNANPEALQAEKDNGKFDKNQDLVITLPLASMKSIGKRAFNSPAITKFMASTAEASRAAMYPIQFGECRVTNFDNNSFYYLADNNGATKYGIVKSTDLYTTDDQGVRTYNPKEYSITDPKPLTFTMYDFDLVAVAGGTTVTTMSFGVQDAATFSKPKDHYRIAIKEGAVSIYSTTVSSIYFANVTKVEANAFVYVNKDIFKDDKKVINYCKSGTSFGIDFYMHMTTKEIAQGMVAYNADTQNVFADGWYMGQDNTKNTFMAEASLQEGQFTPGQ